MQIGSVVIRVNDKACGLVVMYTLRIVIVHCS